MNKFAIVSRKDEISEIISKKLTASLIKNKWINDNKNPELIFCIGGDGTFLHAVHQYLEIINRCSFLAIHTGTLGFFTDYTAEELNLCIQDVLTKKAKIRSVPLLEIEYDDQKYFAVNEMRIENVIQTQLLDVYIDGVYLETFRGTGMCVCTQLGSTAYNRSLKGAVIEEGLDLLQMHEITGIHHQKYRSLGVPYILKPERVIEFQSNSFEGAFLCYDQKHIPLGKKSKIKAKLSDNTIRFAKYREINYVERLKDLY